MAIGDNITSIAPNAFTGSAGVNASAFAGAFFCLRIKLTIIFSYKNKGGKNMLNVLIAGASFGLAYIAGSIMSTEVRKKENK